MAVQNPAYMFILNITPQMRCFFITWIADVIAKRGSFRVVQNKKYPPNGGFHRFVC